MVESGKIGVRQIGVIFSAFLFFGTSFGIMVDNARGDPVVAVSNEVMFYDHFWIADGLDKWTCHLDPVTNKCEKAENDPIGPHWNSWFLEKNGHLYLYSDPAYPTGVAWAESLPYNIVHDYVINLHFRLIADSKLKVVDDGYVLLTVDGDDLFGYNGVSPVLLKENMIINDWYLIEIRVHLSAQNYDVYLGRNWVDNLDFASPSPLNKLVLGDDDSIYPDMHGKGDWDNIIVAYLHPQTWNDDFDDGDIRDWTKVVSPPSFFDISSIEYHSPPYSLRMAQPGEVVYGFTPYYDIARNHDYTTQFWFRIPSGNSVELTVVADGNVRIILIDRRLSAYISETDIRQITTISMNEWHDIFVEISSVSNIYRVTVDGTSIFEDYPFVDETETEYIRAPSQMFVGEHRHAYTGSEAFWDDMEIIEVNHPPVLEWTGEVNFVADGLHPETGYESITPFIYRIKYSDIDGDPPAIDYPKAYVKKGGSNIAGSPFPMTPVKWIGPAGDYVSGRIYERRRYLGIGVDYSYKFEAFDTRGGSATTIELNGPVVLARVEPWWMFHHEPRHSGYSTSLAPNTDYVLWEYTFTSPAMPGMSSTVVKDNMVFFGDAGKKVRALNESTGEIIWEFPTEGEIFSTPAVDNGMVYVNSHAGKLYAIDEFTGLERWSFPTACPFWGTSSPVVADGMVFIGSGCWGSGQLYALDDDPYDDGFDEGVPDPSPDYDLIWVYYTDDAIISSPAVANGLVFFGSYDKKVYALNEFMGTWQWDFTADAEITCSPAVAYDLVFVGSWSGNFYAIDEYLGTLKWNYKTGDSVVSSPAVVDGMVFVGSFDHYLYAFDADPSDPIDEGLLDPQPSSYDLIWTYDTGHHVESSPAVANNKVFVASYYGMLFALDEYTGSWIWEYFVDPYGIEASPAVSDGMVFIHSRGFKVTAFI